MQRGEEEDIPLTEDEDIKHRCKEYSTKLYYAEDHQQTYNRGRERINHHHSGRKWNRLCNRYEVGNYLEQMTFHLNSGRHHEKKILIYFGNCVQRSDTKNEWCRAIFVALSKRGT